MSSRRERSVRRAAEADRSYAGSGSVPDIGKRPTVEVPVSVGITLGQVLKLAGAAGSGGQVKLLLSHGTVTVNGRPEDRRGRKLGPGDMVGLDDRVLYLVAPGMTGPDPLSPTDR